MERKLTAKGGGAASMIAPRPAEEIHGHPAEAELQNYVALNPGDAYVKKNSLPKVKKTQQWFSDALAPSPSRPKGTL